MAVSWIVEYGFAGFDQGSGTVVPCTTNSFNATGLECETSYDFYVRAVCGTDWTSEHWTRVSFTTGDCSEACLAPTNVVATVDLNSVTVSWTPAEGNTAFEVEYGNRGFSHGNGTVVNTNPESIPNGGILGNASRLNGFKLTNSDDRVPFISVTFKPKNGAEGLTVVNLDVEIMQLGNSASDSTYLIDHSKIVNTEVAYLPSGSATAVYAGTFDANKQ